MTVIDRLIAPESVAQVALTNFGAFLSLLLLSTAAWNANTVRVHQTTAATATTVAKKVFHL